MPSPIRVDQVRVEELKEGHVYRSSFAVAWQDFFKGFIEDESFLDERRRILRTRAGLKDDDKHLAASSGAQRFKFCSLGLVQLHTKT